MAERIVVTGMGAVTPLGLGVDALFDGLCAGRCGVGPITRFDTTGLAVTIAAQVPYLDLGLPGKLLRESDAFTQFALCAAAEALGGSLPAAPHRVGVVMGTAMAGIATTAATQESLTAAVHKNVGPRFVPRILGNIAAAQIAMAHGLTGPSLTLSTACASGGDAVATAAMLLLAGEADAVLAVGAESILCPLVLYSLANAGALSRRNDDPLHACRPFDQAASGFVIGEGGAALVLETEAHAKSRGAAILAELAGWSNNTDGYHVTAPRPDGSRAAACMAAALARAGLEPARLGYIHAHGTGTPEGDRAEANALLTLFGTDGPPVSSTKGLTGHMMGAGGIADSIVCIQAIRRALLPPSANLTRPAYDLPLLRETTARAVDTAMANAFGFGGQNSSLVFRRWEG